MHQKHVQRLCSNLTSTVVMARAKGPGVKLVPLYFPSLASGCHSTSRLSWIYWPSLDGALYGMTEEDKEVERKIAKALAQAEVDRSDGGRTSRPVDVTDNMEVRKRMRGLATTKMK